MAGLQGLHVLSLSAALVAGCASVEPLPPSPAALAAVTPDEARQGQGVGARVRWGGAVISVDAGKTRTCFTVLGRPLDAAGRPEQTDANFGRFVACTVEFHDPAGYTAGREVSFVGVVAAPTDGKVGDRDVRLACLDADRVQLWPKRVVVVPAYDPFWDFPYRSPFYRPWPYRWR